jgi:tRNA-(ms[2]io[6]A)-hydroxylase
MPLAAPTPPAWVRSAHAQWPVLLADHANCEKKAASTAIALMFTYTDDVALANRLSRLAREELRHFEQVDALMRELAVPPLRRALRRRPACRAAQQRAASQARPVALRRIDRGALLRAIRLPGGT